MWKTGRSAIKSGVNITSSVYIFAFVDPMFSGDLQISNREVYDEIFIVK